MRLGLDVLVSERMKPQGVEQQEDGGADDQRLGERDEEGAQRLALSAVEQPAGNGVDDRSQQKESEQPSKHGEGEEKRWWPDYPDGKKRAQAVVMDIIVATRKPCKPIWTPAARMATTAAGR